MMFTVCRIDAFGPKSCRHYRHTMSKGFQKLDPRPAASAHRNDRDIGRRIERRQVYHKPVDFTSGY